MKVIIIGSGIAGLMAADQIAGMPGVQITVLSTGAGVSPYVHGINIPLYEKDSVRIFKEDTMNSGYDLSDHRLVDCLCQDSLDVYKDLINLGVEPDQKDGSYIFLKPLGSSYPRIISSGNKTGVKIINRLRNKLLETGSVHFKKDGRALKLLMKDGHLDGVLVYDEKSGMIQRIKAHCIILACGGFSGIFPFSTNSSDIGGDGIAMAYEAGIPLVDLEFVQFEPSVALHPKEVVGKGVITTMFYEGAVLRNVNGQRFMKTTGNQPGECVNKDILSKAIYEEIVKGNAARHGGVYFDATGVGREKLLESYASYVERYLAVGIDIAETPFEIAPAPHTALGGVRIHADSSTDVPGIFAAGEIVGGLHGANRIGGNAGLEILVFGKRAGLGVKKYLQEHCTETADSMMNDSMEFDKTAGRQKIGAEDLSNIRKKMQSLLAENFNVIREGSSMEAAKKELHFILDEVKTAYVPGNFYLKSRLENDLICAWLFANSACARTESVGCHIRTDSIGEDYHYHVVIKKEHGELDLKKEYIKLF